MLVTNRGFSVLGILIIAGLMVLAGCASKKYVRQQTDALQPAIQEANAGVKENAERIDSVDKRAQQGAAAAATADAKAVGAQTAADNAAGAAQAADRKADSANQGVQTANTRITTLQSQVNNINVMDNYTAGKTETVSFELNRSVLTNDAKSTLDKIASDMTSKGTGYMLE